MGLKESRIKHLTREIEDMEASSARTRVRRDTAQKETDFYERCLDSELAYLNRLRTQLAEVEKEAASA